MEGGGEGKAILQGKYELGRLLGHGNFGKVHMASDLKTGNSVAMKVVGRDKVVKVGMVEQLKREISVMKLVTHPNIVELHEVLASRSRIYLAMELVRGGELFSRIARRGRFREDKARRYFRQLISAVDFCHSRGVYHRDLKPENLLLDDKGNLKIADFGLSALADLHPDGLLHTTCGTPAYVAPEVVLAKSRGGYDGAKADLWSCGVVLYVMLAGCLPFQDDNIVAMYKKMQRGDFRCQPWFSPEARRLVTRLLDPNPATRLTMARLMETPWFRRKRATVVEEEEVVSGRWGKERPETLNAFHIISLSEGFDLSPMFEGEVAGRGGGEGMRFAVRSTAKGVVERLEGMAAANGGKYRLVKGKEEAVVRLQGVERGRMGRLSVAAEIFTVAEDVLVVEVKKEAGDSLEYQRFCSDGLRPALEDIIWESPPEPTTGD